MPSGLVSRALDAYEEVMAHFFLLRMKLFPWWYEWRFRSRFRRDMMAKFGYIPSVGTVVNDCRGQNHAIASVDPSDPDTVTLDDGMVCSLWHCCGPVPHEEPRLASDYRFVTP